MRGIIQESTQKDALVRGFTITNDQNEKLEFIKNPIVTEFLGISSNTDFTESALEKSILKHSIESPKVLGGTRKGLCLCRTTVAHSHRKAGLLYRSGVLQPHPKMFRAD